ncbi:MAG: PKD domain-containing protein [Bacteroidales bacterium]|nr:PKD domain-containing protein [Bacteroidales bacterium]
MRKFILSIMLPLLYAVSAYGQCSTTAKFGYSYVGCSVIQFTDSSTTSANYRLVKWHWNFGDGDTASSPNVTHAYTPGLNVTVKLVVTAEDSLGNICQDSTTQIISIRTLPTVHIESTPNPACLDEIPQFTGTSNHAIKSWQWIFGDGDTVNIQNPAHQYADTGSYNVILHVLDSSGCSNQNDTVYIQRINPIPTVNFTWNPNPATTADNIQFNGTSNAIPGATTIAWHWNFGDGDTANVQNPTHRYSVAGQDTVTLTVDVNGSCTNSVTKVLTINPYVAPNFTYSVSCLKDITYFTDSSTTGSGISILTWKWYFGDGDSTIINSPNNPNTTHIYVTQATYPVTLVTVTSAGFQRSITKNITVVPKPTAFFTFNDTCYTKPTSFYDKSSTNGGSAVNSWHWTFGDGDSANVQDTMHTYAYPGSYPVTLYIQNADGCKDTVQRTMVMDSLPVVDFSMSRDTICQGESITFSGQGTNISSWQWDFGNGATSTYQTATNRFTTAGLDTVRLTVKDLKGCSSSVYHTVFVKPTPSANFDFTILCKGDTTCFLDKSTPGSGSSIVQWNWNFGDTTFSSAENPDHYYKPIRNYNATLTVTSNEACSSSITKLIIFDSLPTPNFAVSNACMSDMTHFTDISTTPGSSYIRIRKWYFGDGSMVVADSSQFMAGHIYKDTTTYDVKLVVTNSFGKTDSITKRITVHKKPLADFTFNDTCYTKPITFTDLSKKDGGSALSAWNWNFGDSLSGTKNTDTLQNSMHAMSYPGSYYVQLITSNTDGCSDTAIRNIVVDSLPDVAFTVQRDTMCFGEKGRFYGIGNNIASWHWDFGNGDTSFYQDPVYQYPKPGKYVVTLTVKDLKGCSNYAVDTVFVDDNPKAGFSFGPSCTGDSTYFSDKTTSSDGFIKQWQWNFGDTASVSNQSSLENPAHSFTAVGTYVTKLVVRDNYGCTDSVSHFVNVYDHPRAAFSYHQACDPATRVDFTDQSVRSSSKSPISSYLWRFYQNDTSSLQNPSYRFPDYDSCYQVMLTVTDTNGCWNTDTAKVCLRDSLTVNFTMSKVCLGTRTPFTASYKPYNDSIASYTWNFGDGSAEVITYHDTVSHRFPRPGSYNVMLSAVDTNGCKVSVAHLALVDSLPQPDFTYVTPNCDQPTYFEGSTRGGGNFISTWKWNFGDIASGTADTSTLQNPNHLYPSGDSIYQVKLVVMNFNGCIDSVTKPITKTSCLHVLYTVNTPTGCAKNPIYFKDHTTLGSSRGSINKWNWDFGDGQTETYTAYRDSVLHVYNSAGTYHVILSVTATVNNIPFTNTYDSIIQIYRPPVANFVFSNACTNQEVYFTDSTKTYDSNLSQWQWSFNDPYSSDNSSRLQDPVHLYDTTGTFPARLIVTDNNNCHDTVTKPVAVHPTPVASFNITENYSGVTGQVLLDNTSTGASSYFWDFGDGNISTEVSPVYRYTSIGIFKILLTATSDYLCSDTTSKVIDLTSGLYVPNSFAPGMDNPGINTFMPKGVHLKEYDIQIYSAWGNLLWESKKLNANGEPVEGWNGTYKGQPMPEGDYIWRIKAIFLDGSAWKGSDDGDGNKKPYGTLLLIR